MSENPMDGSRTGRHEDLSESTQRPVETSDDSRTEGDAQEAQSRSEFDLPEGQDVSAGTDGVGGGNDSRSSVLEDTLGAGGDPDETNRGL